VVTPATGSLGFPTDWYPGDWDPMLAGINHYLGESPATDIADNGWAILGPVEWPSQLNWLQYSLLVEARADNDDAASGSQGCPSGFNSYDCDNTCTYWDNNNITVRSRVLVTIQRKFWPKWDCGLFIHCPYCPQSLIDVICEKGPELGDAAIDVQIKSPKMKKAARAARMTKVPDPPNPREVVVYGGKRVSAGYQLQKRRSALRFEAGKGQRLEIRLSGQVPRTLDRGASASVRVLQRAEGRLRGFVDIKLIVEDKPRSAGSS
jgi:hypothetical protein